MPRHFLGEFEKAVLLALMRLGDDAYGVTIREELATRLEREVSIGAVYTTLGRLEEKGFVSSILGSPTPERGGRAKRFFHIEADGAEALRNSLAAHDALTEFALPTLIPSLERS
jgi:DNA-binding PadR family transcriptional regulator